MDEYRNQRAIEDIIIPIKNDFLNFQGVDLGDFYVSFGAVKEDEDCRVFSSKESKEENIRDFPLMKKNRIYSSFGSSRAFDEELYFSDNVFMLLNDQVKRSSVVHECAHIGLDRVWDGERFYEKAFDEGWARKLMHALHEGVALRVESDDGFRKDYSGEDSLLVDGRLAFFGKEGDEVYFESCRQAWMCKEYEDMLKNGEEIDGDNLPYIIGWNFVRNVWRESDNLASIVGRFKGKVPTDKQVLEPGSYIERTKGV